MSLRTVYNTRLVDGEKLDELPVIDPNPWTWSKYLRDDWVWIEITWAPSWSNGYVQYNDWWSFWAEWVFTYNSSTNTLSVPNIDTNLSHLTSSIETITASSDTLDDTNYTVLCDCTSNAITINLPAASSSSWRVYNIKKIDSSANAITIDWNWSETIDWATTQLITWQYTNIKIQSDGTEWFIL